MLQVQDRTENKASYGTGSALRDGPGEDRRLGAEPDGTRKVSRAHEEDCTWGAHFRGGGARGE